MNIYFVRAEKNGNLDILSTFHLRNNAGIFDYIRNNYTCNYRLTDVFNSELNFSLKIYTSWRNMKRNFHCLKIPGELI